jgi:hypothetical protein
MMKRAAWLLLVRLRAVLGDRAQKRKMRDNDGIRADWQTAVYRSKYALCVTKTDKSYAIAATKDSRSDLKKNMDDDHMQPSWLKHMASRSAVHHGWNGLGPPKELDDAPAVGQSWTGQQSSKVLELLGGTGRTETIARSSSVGLR